MVWALVVDSLLEIADSAAVPSREQLALRVRDDVVGVGVPEPSDGSRAVI